MLESSDASLYDEHGLPVTPATSSADLGGAILRSRLVFGGAFIFDVPDLVPAVWGAGDRVLWAEGEALTICGPPGVGKTTLAGQVLRARLVGGMVLDLPVTPTGSRVLYLAMDRPRQISRALGRTFNDLPRDVVDARLVVWEGPPPADVAASPETLLALVHAAEADTVVIDSIKDAAVGLSDDKVGAGYNRARQLCIAEGVEVLELHHMVKRGDNGAPPNSLADMYGSTWIGAGAGSVVNLHGDAGDLVVSFKHLKTPADEVGPFKVIHDHDAGTSAIYHQSDLVALARAAGLVGITAKQAAQAITEKDKPSASEVEKARRRLNNLTSAGDLVHGPGVKGGESGGTPAKWVYGGDHTDHESDHARDRSPTDHGTSDRSRPGDFPLISRGKSDHESDHGDHAPTDHVLSPPFRGENVNGPRSPLPTDDDGRPLPCPDCGRKPHHVVGCTWGTS